MKEETSKEIKKTEHQVKAISLDGVNDFLDLLEHEKQELMEDLNAENLSPRELYERKLKRKQEKRKMYEDKGYVNLKDHPFLKKLTE